MGVKSFIHEIKTKVSASRLFKALVVEPHDFVPKCIPDAIKSVETVAGSEASAGCVRKTTAPDGSTFKYVIDAIDTEKHTVKYTLSDGKVLGDKIEKICYNAMYEDTADGCVIKLASEYHIKGGADISDDEIKAGEEQGAGLYKVAAEYLAANPHVCA